MTYDFLVDTYETERLKVLGVLEQMVHQCVSEDLWFHKVVGIDVDAPPLSDEETRHEFIRRYAIDSARRLFELRNMEPGWWEQMVEFFDIERSRAWAMVRRIAHTSHHRGQQMAMLRMLGRDVHGNYGPTGDLMQNGAPVIYAYDTLDDLLDPSIAENPLPGSDDHPSTERPR